MLSKYEILLMFFGLKRATTFYRYRIYETLEISHHASRKCQGGRSCWRKNRPCLRGDRTCDISAEGTCKNGRYESIGGSRRAKYAMTHIAVRVSVLRKRKTINRGNPFQLLRSAYVNIARPWLGTKLNFAFVEVESL